MIKTEYFDRNYGKLPIILFFDQVKMKEIIILFRPVQD